MDGIHIIQMMIKHMDTKIKLFLEYALSDKQSQKPDEDIPDCLPATARTGTANITRRQQLEITAMANNDR